MIAFTEIVGDEFGHRPAEMAFTERDHLAQALLLDRPHDPVLSQNSTDRLCG